MAQRCAGCPYSGDAVGPRGPVDAPVVCVGEAPGAEELRVGIPFIGQSGKLLVKTLAKAGISEDEVFFTNALRCRPPVGKPPVPEAIDACRLRLLGEVGNAPRRIVISLGNTALRSLLHDHKLKITSARGKAVTVGGGVGIVLPTYHPALILRSFGEYPRFTADLRYAATFLDGATPKTPGDTRWDLVTGSNIKTVVDFLLHQPRLAADIETSGFSPRDDRVLCLSVAWARNRVAVFPWEHPLDPKGNLARKWPKTLRKLLETAGPKWVWHNGKFDTSFFQELGIDARVDDDCMLLHYTQNEVKGTHDLAQLGSDFLGAPNWKNAMVEAAIRGGYMKSKKESYAKIPPSILYPYNARDADITLQLYGELEAEQQKGAGSRRLYEHLLIPASRTLQKVEAAGMWVNTEYLDEVEKDYRAEEEVQINDLIKLSEPVWDVADYVRKMRKVKPPTRFNPGSPDQLKYVLHRMGFRVANTRDETLRELPDTPFVHALRDFRKTHKIIGTYIEGVQKRIESDERVHSTYLIHGTVTGRLSSRNPNMQNIPRGSKIRNVFQAPPGRTFIECDYSQVELRVLAVLSDDTWLKGVYYDGRDLHDEVAAALYPGWTARKDTVRGREERIRAKFVNFGIAYGRGAKSLVEEFKMPMPEAVSIIRDWFSRAPQVASYLKELRDAPASGRVLSTVFGRRRRFGLVTRENLVPLQNEATNFPISSTASDLTLLSAMKIYDRLVNRWKAHIVNLVHDSILIEAPKEVDLEELEGYVREVMSTLPGRVLHTDVPFEVSMKEGARWGDLKN